MNFEPQNPATAVGFLDHNDLICCGKQMQVLPHNFGYGCQDCGWHLTQHEFLRNSHGTQEARRGRIARKEVGADRLMVHKREVPAA